MEACAMLAAVIKRVLGARRMTARALLKAVEKTHLSDETLDRIEDVVRIESGSRSSPHVQDSLHPSPVFSFQPLDSA